jgi:hypothetical protein
MPRLLDERFTDLADTPKFYSGSGGHVVRVKVDADGLEFVPPESLDSNVQTFLELTDTPNDYTDDDALKLVRVKANMLELEFVDVGVLVGAEGGTLATPTTFIDLTDTPISYTGENNKFVRVSGSALVFDTMDFLELADVSPSSYTGQNGKQVVVNPAGDGLTFTASYDTFLSLTDTPNDYGALDGGRVVRVKSDLSELEFSDFTFTSLSDTPDNYATFQNSVIKVNGTGDALVFAPEIDTFLRLTDTPNEYLVGDAGKLVRVRSDFSGLEFVNPADVVASAFSFLDLTDTPDNYTDAVGKYLQVKADSGDGRRIQFADAEAIAGDIPTVVIELKLYDENYTTGTRPVASGANAIAIGEGCVASGANANVAGGKNNIASGQFAVVAGGSGNVVRRRVGR